MGKLTIPKDKQAGWDALDPAFRTKVTTAAGSVPHDSILVFGKRTLEEQKDLYAQGRTTPGNIVTKAEPGLSAHNWGLAVDLLPVNPATGKGDWNYDAGFKAMAEAAKKQGLTSGYFWKFKDSPHIEDPSFTVAKAKEWLKGAGAALGKAATSKAGITAGGITALLLTGTLALVVYNRKQREKRGLV